MTTNTAPDVVDTLVMVMAHKIYRREFRILPRELTEEREEVTASLKVRRAVVIEHFSDVIESIYAPAGGPSPANRP